MTAQLREAIARLRAGMHNGRYCGDQSDDIELVCDALDAHLKPAPSFDKRAYQREYMRRRRGKCIACGDNPALGEGAKHPHYCKQCAAQY